ncbi:M20 metallopeptidase family protein [Flindersiella endophytica]
MYLPPDQKNIDAATARIDHGLIELRRSIHRHPELAGEEVRTSTLVADQLRATDLAVTTGIAGHGVIAVLDGVDEGPTIAYRADLDAVEDEELFVSDFASQIPGAAHLCGHDLHTAIGVGVAKVLSQLRTRWAGRIVFIFQPAEETITGARAMVEEGALGLTSPQEIYALHCGPLEFGSFAVGPGQPGQDHIRIELTGQNVVADAERLATMIGELSTVHRPQTPQQFEQLLRNLLTPDGPLARFVFADIQTSSHDKGARVDAWLRAWPSSQYVTIRGEVQGWVEALPHARVECSARPFPAMVCSPELNEQAARHLRSVVGADSVLVTHAAFPFNGDDFAYFLEQIPGAMFYLGVANPEAGLNGITHAPDFAADERAIGLGVRAMAGFLLDRLRALA